MYIDITDHVGNKRRVQTEFLSGTRLPWNPAQLAAFEVYHEDIDGVDDVARFNMPTWVLGTRGPYLCGVLKTPTAPQRVIRGGPHALLTALFPDYKEAYEHRGGPLTHPGLLEIPEGEVGAGVIVVRNVTDLSLGTGAPLRADAVTRAGLYREHAERTLLELGYERKS